MDVFMRQQLGKDCQQIFHKKENNHAYYNTYGF